MKTFILFVAILALSESSIPSNFKRCSRKDANFNSCLFDAAQHGITQLTKPYKELNLPSLDPMEVSSLTVKAGNGPIAVNQNFKNCEFFGFVNMKLEKFAVDFEKKTLDVIGVVPELTAKCQYRVDGKILLLTIDGQGNSTINFKNFRAALHASFTEKIKKGKTYLRFEKSEMEADPENVHMQFDNIFGNNKELSDNTNQVFNDNWKEIWQEIKSDYTELMKTVMTQMISNLFNKVPIDELYE